MKVLYKFVWGLYANSSRRFLVEVCRVRVNAVNGELGCLFQVLPYCA